MDEKQVIFVLALVIILVVWFLYYKSQAVRRKFEAEVRKGLNRLDAFEKSKVTENDIKDLPKPVQKYLAYVGVIGKEKAL
jgi:AAA+ superfamily predicted ATPase